MSIKKLNRAYLKLYMISLIGITLVFLVFGYSILKSFKEEQLDTMMEHSISVADQYSYMISTSVEASGVINNLLTERIITVGKTLTKTKDWENIDIMDLGKTFDLDTLNIYDKTGVVVGSMDSANLGYKADRLHPAYTFIDSNEAFHIDSFDEEANIDSNYKFAYFKLDDNKYVQIGILQNRIQNFVKSIEIQSSLERIKDNENYEYMSFIDDTNTIQISTDTDRVGRLVVDNKMISIINNDKREGILRDSAFGRVYEVLVPVYQDGKKMGTLSMAKNISSTEEMISRITAVGLLVITIIYTVFLFLVTSTHKKSKELVGLAYFDSLTGLPNFQYLKEKMQESLPQTQGQKKALILVNCNNFKMINMLLGYDLGDELISEMGKKINTISNEQITVVRFTADRFLIYVEDYQERTDLISLLEEIDQLFKEPLRIENTIKYLSLQYAIIEFEDVDKTMDQLLKEVLVTIGTLSPNGINYAFFTYNTGRKLQLHETIENDLRSVLEEEEDSDSSLHILYQPIYSLKTGEITGFEALSRLVSPKYGEIPPLEFIEVAEKKKLIEPLGNLIFVKACQYARKLADRGFGHLSVSINISGLQILQEDFIDMVQKTLKSHKVNPESITLEITESVFMDSLDMINHKMEQLRAMGISIALDDFGTGYSSLNRLKSLSVDILKVDQSFISPITHENNEQHIAQDIISMAHRTGLNVVAEGVESEDQILYLLRNKCDRIQGYYCGKPMREEEANLLLLSDSCVDLRRVIDRLNWSQAVDI